MSDDQALLVAGKLVERWRATEDEDDGTLQRLLANNLVALTDRSAHIGAINTMAEVMSAANQIPEQREDLHLRLVEQSVVSEGLLTTLHDVDAYLLLFVTSINEMLDRTEDPDVREYLTKMRESVMMVDEHIRDTCEQFTEE